MSAPRAMKEVRVTEPVASLIDKLRDDEGYNAEMAYLCQAFAGVANLASLSEQCDDDTIIPLAVLARYCDLLKNLAQSD